MKKFFAYLIGFLIGYYAVGGLAMWLTSYDLSEWDYWQRWVIYAMQLLVGFKLGKTTEHAYKSRIS